MCGEIFFVLFRECCLIYQALQMPNRELPRSSLVCFGAEKNSPLESRLPTGQWAITPGMIELTSVARSIIAKKTRPEWKKQRQNITNPKRAQIPRIPAISKVLWGSADREFQQELHVHTKARFFEFPDGDIKKRIEPDQIFGIPKTTPIILFRIRRFSALIKSSSRTSNKTNRVLEAVHFRQGGSDSY